MLYTGFINCLRKAETTRVKALSIPSSCALTQIPCAFQMLIPHIVKLIDQNIDQFCHVHQIVAWFGLQVTSGGIQSNLPQQLNRIHYPYYANVHFCCVLSYLTVDHDAFSAIDSWQNYQSLVIDFTTGDLMDNQHYIFQMLGQSSPGRIYGQLDQKLLKKAWTLATKEKQRLISKAAEQEDSVYLMGKSAYAG